jgi:poly-gamma-glutamate synthesis protein (capsule biosynthesis protein)
LIFAGPPASAEVLALSGVHVVSTANNHAWDYGKPALLETLSYLEQTGVARAGTGATLAEAEAPALLEIGGKRLAFFAVTQIWNHGEFKRHPGREHVAWADSKSVAERVARAKLTHDLVFVSYHGGAEYVNAPWTALPFADQVMRAGADALFGHHPHVIQGIGWFDERPAFYSLGNLLFGSRKGYPWTRYGMLARLTFSPDGTRRTAVCPYRIEIGSHEPDVLDGPYGGSDRARFLRQLERVNAHVGKTTLGAPDEFGCVDVSNARPSKGGVRSLRSGFPGPL